jgi:hypothetical protein
VSGEVNREERAFQLISGNRALDLLATLISTAGSPSPSSR